MRTIWLSLAWKEWHEHKWKLVSLVAILWGICLLALVELDEGALIGLYVGLMLGIAPLAVFIGLGTAAGERSRGTLPFLQALPVPMWRVALNKLIFGLITILVPALLSIAFILAWVKCLDLLGIEYRAAADFANFAARSQSFLANAAANWAAHAAFAAALVGASFYIWTIAAGVNRKDEVSAGALALTVIAVWWLLLTFAWQVLVAQGWISRAEPNWLEVFELATAPGGLTPLVFERPAQTAQYLPFGLAVATVTHVVLAAWYIFRFARVSNQEVRSPKTAVIGPGPLAWLGPPRRSPLTAIIWKQFRESLPLILVGLAITVGTAAIVVNGTQLSDFGDIYSGVAVAVGLAVAMIVGIGVFYSDVAPKQNEFWRSRPIRTDLWFWTRFLSGLALLLLAIYGPILLIALFGGGLRNSNHPDVLIFPAIHITIFAAAVAMICLVRHAVYAAILSIAVTYAGIAIVSLGLLVGRLIGWVERPVNVMTDLTQAQVIAGLTMSFVFCTVLAWLAVRYDWGQKSGY